MSRVLLMVQGAGDKRPKCAKSFGPAQGLNRARAHAYCARIVNRRWWLVETYGADAARVIIACSQGNCDSVEGCVCGDHGTVLATGGAREGGEA